MDDHTCSYRDIPIDIAIDILADYFKMQSFIEYK